MRRIKLIILSSVLAVSLLACSKKEQETAEDIIIEETVPEDEEAEDEESEELEGSEPQDPSYSHNTVIVMVEEGTTLEQVEDMCDDYNLSILYNYEIISGYALSTGQQLTDKALDSLIASLEEYDFVLGVEKDYIMDINELDSTGESDAGTSDTETRIETTSVDDTDNFYGIEFTENSAIFSRIKGLSYKDDCPIPVSDLRYLHVLHKGFDGQTHEGEIICNKYIAEDLLEIFEDLYEADYPIESIKLVDEFGADDEASMEANNSSCFNFRYISHTKKISKHGYGLAMDINTLYNPYVKTVDGTLVVEPATATAYADRSKDFDYKIDEEDLAYQLFISHGFQWGGAWNSSKDYQHFEVPDSVVDSLY